MLNKLRSVMKKVQLVEHPIQAYIVTNSDPHNSEYLSENYKRLKFISNFSGSSGTAVITEDKALLWTDGRYYTQANKELDSNWTLMKAGLVTTPTEGVWLSQNLPKGSRIGVDPKCISCSIWQNLHQDLDAKGLSLVPVPSNLIDEVWENKPEPVLNPIKPLDLKYTGKTSGMKVEAVRKTMKEKGVDVYVVTALDDIAYLLNLRGSDIEHNPVFFSFVVVQHDSLHFFVSEERITSEIREHFKKENIDITIHPYDSVYSFISSLTSDDSAVQKIWVPQNSNYHIYSLIPEKKRLCELSTITLMKAIKNPTEVEYMVRAHIQDGIALCRYFSWLETEVPKGNVTEISGATQLQKFREETEGYIGLSFPTISSSGPNGAIIHYQPSPETDRPLTVDEVYLCDSGGQFLGGTTDVTRTMHFGIPTQMERECFTRVFKGQTALGTTVFPNKLKGNCLDALARTALWKVGLDYGHGTGHGIGSYLNVHEGPMGISNRPYPDDPGIEENMFLSNEPGFYLEGKFGIRLENIVHITSAKTPHNFMDRGFLVMDTITLCPIQTKMLIISELTAQEIDYLNSYHKKCLDILGPLLKQKGYESAYLWLLRETLPV